MKNFKKYLALRLLAVMLFPYSAPAAAACQTQLDYGAGTGPDMAYESVAYHVDTQEPAMACGNTIGNSLEAHSGINLPPSGDQTSFSL